MHWIEMAIGDIPKYYFVPLKYSNSRKFAWKKSLLRVKTRKHCFVSIFSDLLTMLLYYIYSFLSTWPLCDLSPSTQKAVS